MSANKDFNTLVQISNQQISRVENEQLQVENAKLRKLLESCKEAMVYVGNAPANWNYMVDAICDVLEEKIK